MITAGFGETGEQGRVRERALVEKIRRAGIRMVGPNCMGVINTDPWVQIHATFAPAYPSAGNVAMSSQSGALGLAVLDYARALNIGFSTFISVGNKADVSGNDLIQYWAEDPNTDVILLYLESFGNPRKFGEIARRVGKTKPIVAVKAGRSAAGAKAASSHTGALATSDAIVDDLFRQAGIIRTGTLEEMFDVAALLANQPLPPGRRVAILTNAGGPGILARRHLRDRRLLCVMDVPAPRPDCLVARSGHGESDRICSRLDTRGCGVRRPCIRGIRRRLHRERSDVDVRSRADDAAPIRLSRQRHLSRRRWESTNQRSCIRR